MIDMERIAQDLWPSRREYRIKQALADKVVHLSLGEAETLACQETKREVAKRLKFYELMGRADLHD